MHCRWVRRVVQVREVLEDRGRHFLSFWLARSYHNVDVIIVLNVIRVSDTEDNVVSGFVRSEASSVHELHCTANASQGNPTSIEC